VDSFIELLQITAKRNLAADCIPVRIYMRGDEETLMMINKLFECFPVLAFDN
jgi:hypothetical protein